MLAVGWEDRPATARELGRTRPVADGMREGAVGMSSGPTYTPGMYAQDAELTELCRVVAEYGGYDRPHHHVAGTGRAPWRRTRRWCPSPVRRAARSTSPTPP